MSRIVCPVFGDVLLKGAVLFAWLFILFLLWDIWWQKRQARLIREQGGIPWPNRTNRRARNSFKRFRWAFAVLAVVPIVTLILARGQVNNHNNSNNNNSSDESGLSAYATNFQGDATCPVPATNTLNLNLDDSASTGAQASAETNNAILMFEPLSTAQASNLSTNTANPGTPASSSDH